MSRVTGANATAANPEAAKSKLKNYRGTAEEKLKSTIAESNTV